MSNFGWYVMINCDFGGPIGRRSLYQRNDGMYFVTVASRIASYSEKFINIGEMILAQCTTEAAGRAAFALLRNGPEAFRE